MPLRSPIGRRVCVIETMKENARKRVQTARNLAKLRADETNSVVHVKKNPLQLGKPRENLGLSAESVSLFFLPSACPGLCACVCVCVCVCVCECVSVCVCLLTVPKGTPVDDPHFSFQTVFVGSLPGFFVFFFFLIFFFFIGFALTVGDPVVVAGTRYRVGTGSIGFQRVECD